jgi:hypothetical protein
MTLLPSLFLVLLVSPAPPAVSPGELTSFLKVISASAGAPGRIACKDMDLSIQLKKNGLSPDAKAPLAWAANEEQLRGYLAEGKLVVTGDAGLLAAGAGIAIVRENGKPVIRVQACNLAASGVTLSDALLKISKVSQ